MKSTGIVRRVDDLGRIVLPKELRDTMGIATRDPLEVFVEGDKILLRKYEPFCIFCGENENTVTYRGKVLCRHCLKKLGALKQEEIQPISEAEAFSRESA